MDSNENCGRNSTLKIIAAYGPASGIFQISIGNYLLADHQKCDSLNDYDTLYKVWFNRMKIGSGADF